MRGDLEKAKCFGREIKLKKYVNKDLKIKIFRANLKKDELHIEEIQVEGKNKITWEEFKNGYLDSANSTD